MILVSPEFKPIFINPEVLLEFEVLGISPKQVVVAEQASNPARLSCHRQQSKQANILCSRPPLKYAKLCSRWTGQCPYQTLTIFQP